LTLLQDEIAKRKDVSHLKQINLAGNNL
jgi:hypothetical protein